MTTEYQHLSQPDILEVIANLSNDEVFTPPKVANAVLDLLPTEVWSDPTLRWLDPGCKTGIFPREITKRLMVGLAEAIPDESRRLQHILTEMVFAIAITDLTGMMSRRTLYCSKDASGEFSVVRFAKPSGNIWHERVEHDFDDKGKCNECGGTREQLESVGRDNYAYAFIHLDGQEKLKREIGMHFDVIVGNPPYQMDAESGNRTMPIYNLFVNEAKKLNPSYMAFIIPSRWMAGGLGLSDFRAEMLKDRRIRHLVDFPNASEVFPGVEIKGGVCYFLWNRDKPGQCAMTLVRGDVRHGPTFRDLDQFDVLIRDSRALGILDKVIAKGEASLTEILAVDKEFGMTSNWDDFRKTKEEGDIAFYYNEKGKRLSGWIPRKSVPKSDHLIDKWKVLVPKAGSDGGQRLPDLVIGTPVLAAPPSVCTQTYLFVYISSHKEAESVDAYIRTRFVRFLISLRKISQDATRSTYTWVPQQSWDRIWTDDELYEKYGITEDEQAYIATMVKEMPA
ncbi:Eco57I restriction-modification methylase domain-containing protein [Ferrimicrobium acidiphilum]|uniref:Eco57I restriction-modification methylase domain-containing protein n=1 Tax=Ferrimicrobium acidiphilum TaxID=121039 RepID=UPI0023F5947B|nr:Eco57I restriction-modification methylase domain-containing protein [Ferrimicrobium acidiphilum]